MERHLQNRSKEETQVRYEDLVVAALPKKKKGRPLLLGEELEKEVKSYLVSFREKGAVINTAIIRAYSEGI